MGLGLLLLATDASAQIACGDVLGPGGSFVADADIGPCVELPALRIVGPVKVDFAGHAVSCNADTAVGIEITGKGAKVSNGSVSGCHTGVEISGDGKHKLEEMMAELNQALGFEVNSAGNKLTHNTAFQNGFGGGPGDGFIVRGAKNTLTENWGVDNTDEGFEVDGTKVKMTGNVAVNNTGEGVRIDAGSGKYKKNLLSSNITGFRVGGTGCAFTSNVTIAHGTFEGFFITAGDGKYSKNVAVGNADAGMDFTGGGDDNKVTKTFAAGNVNFGFEVEGQGNSLKSNVAIGNGDTDLVDLNGNCTDNTWSKNLFSTASPICIE